MSAIEREKIEELVHKYQNRSISPKEFEQLHAWYLEQNDTLIELPLENEQRFMQIKNRMLDNLNQKLNEESRHEFSPRHSIWNRKWVRIGAAAAAILLILTFGLHTWMLDLETNEPNQARLAENFRPGGNRAVLMMEDGRSILLRSDQEGLVVGERLAYLDGTELDKLEDGALKSNGILNTITPKGGTYMITLEDGTKVWLNANTTLRYPSQFEGDREVWLEGEAYFEVAKQQSPTGKLVPFRITTNAQQVEVLGTSFNICAYPEQVNQKTTLVEGSVQVQIPDSDVPQVAKLRPGEQSVLSPDNKLAVKQVDVRPFVAWKEGRFQFDGKSFAEIMSEIEHWYDLEVEYKGTVPKKELVGDAYRNQNLGLVLRVLDVAEISYEIDTAKRKLIIL